MKTDKRYSFYPCSWCCRWNYVEKGNHHPFCCCGSDQFNWSEGYTDITREEVKKLIDLTIIKVEQNLAP